jgi:hypothetical protein
MKQGTKVYDIRFGWGVVKEVTEGIYPVKVWFKTGEPVQYTIDGKDYIGQDEGLLKEKQYYHVTQDEIHKYAEFAILCDRKGMKILNFEDFIKL